LELGRNCAIGGLILRLPLSAPWLKFEVLVHKKFMERHNLPQKTDVSLKGLMRVLPIIVGFLVILFSIVLEMNGLTRIVLTIASFFAFFVLYMFISHRITTLKLLNSPCPKCGRRPMRFEQSSEGDYAFICDNCQIEWTLNAPPWRQK
jgi:hypothetical protein